jgi:hypothetical protein
LTTEFNDKFHKWGFGIFHSGIEVDGKGIGSIS